MGEPDRSSQPGLAPAAQAQTTRQRIGERVQAARLAAHLTQEELAGPDYSNSSLSSVERGKITPSFQALRLIAERLGGRGATLDQSAPRRCVD